MIFNGTDPDGRILQADLTREELISGENKLNRIWSALEALREEGWHRYLFAKTSGDPDFVWYKSTLAAQSIIHALLKEVRYSRLEASEHWY